MEYMKTFFGGWGYGIKEGKGMKNKIILTGRIIKHSFQGLWLYHIKPKLLTRFKSTKGNLSNL